MAGRAPFVSADPHELFEKHATLRPPKPSAFNAGLPEAADELVGAMLAKEPASRPTLPQIREALAALRTAPVSVLAPARVVASAQATAILGEVRSDIVTAPRRGLTSHRRRWPLIVGAAAVAIAGVGVAAMTRGGPATPPTMSARRQR